MKFDSSIANSFNTYLEHEKACAAAFLEDRFDHDEYRVVKSLWLDQKLIDGLYLVIDDVVKKEKINKDIRFLIIGDFLFSLSSFDLADPLELVLKISRNSYMYRIRLRCSINIIFDIAWHQYILIHQKLLIGLESSKILKKSSLRTSKNGTWQTEVYFTLLIDGDFLKQGRVLGTSLKPFILMDIEGCKYSVGSFRNV